MQEQLPRCGWFAAGGLVSVELELLKIFGGENYADRGGEGERILKIRTLSAAIQNGREFDGHVVAPVCLARSMALFFLYPALGFDP